MKKQVREIFEAEAKAILGIPVDESYEKAINLIYEHVHKRGGKLVTCS